MNILARGKKNIWWVLPLILVFTVQCFFMVQKEGYHMDELLSYELSNAQFNPWIVPTQPVGRLAKYVNEEINGDTFGETLANIYGTLADVVQNRGNSKMLQYKADVYSEPVWISAGQFQDYLTVDAQDAFQYLSVYFNVKDDNHPPVHFMLLHTVSSLFRETIAPFQGQIINMLAILGCCVLLMHLGMLLEAGKVISEGCGRLYGACAAVLYGVSSGAIATGLLIRMYGILTFFCTALFYLHIKKWLEEGFDKKNKAMIAVTVLGFLTQYFFLFYCIGLALVTTVLLIGQKRYKELKLYICSMILAAVFGVGLFPFALSDVFSSSRGVEALENLRGSFADYWIRIQEFGSILLTRCFGRPVFALAGAAGIVALCSAVLWKKKRGLPVFWRKENWAVGILLVFPVFGYFLLAAKVSPYLVDRYIMALFPFMALIVTLLFGAVVRELCSTRIYLVVVPVLLLGALNVAFYDGEYLYQGYEDQVEISRAYGDYPCICLYDGTGYYYNLLEFMEYERTLLLKLPELEQRQESEELAGVDELVVLRKSEVDEEAMYNALEDYGWKVERELLAQEDSVYGDTIYLCVRKEDI